MGPPVPTATPRIPNEAERIRGISHHPVLGGLNVNRSGSVKTDRKEVDGPDRAFFRCAIVSRPATNATFCRSWFSLKTVMIRRLRCRNPGFYSGAAAWFNTATKGTHLAPVAVAAAPKRRW